MTLEAAGKPDEAGRAYETAWMRDPASPVKAYLVLRQSRDLDAASRERSLNVLRDASRRNLSGNQRQPSPPFLTLGLVPDTLSPTPIAGDGRLSRVFAHLASGQLDEATAALKDSGPAAS